MIVMICLIEHLRGVSSYDQIVRQHSQSSEDGDSSANGSKTTTSSDDHSNGTATLGKPCSKQNTRIPILPSGVFTSEELFRLSRGNF